MWPVHERAHTRRRLTVQNLEERAAQTTQGTNFAPPGWYDDWAGTGEQRWWDGAQWTGYVQGKPQSPSRTSSTLGTKSAWQPWKHLLQTHAKSAVLFALTIVAATIGFSMNPPDQPSHAKTNITEVDIYLPKATNAAQTPASEQRVTLDLKNDGHGGTEVRVAAGGTDVDSFTVTVPKDTWGSGAKDCGHNQPKDVAC